MSDFKNVIKANKATGGLGRTNPSTDGYAGLIAGGVTVAGKYDTLGTVVKLIQASDADVYGFTAALDSNEGMLLRYHIDEFFRIAPNGTLFVMVVDRATTQASMANKTADFIAKMAKDTTVVKGNLRFVATVLNPPADDMVGALSIDTAGTGYAVDDTLAGTGGAGTGFAGKVTSVGGSGEITGVEITSFGSGYTSAPTLSITTSGGSSGVITCTLGYTPTTTNGIDTDVEAAVTNAQDLIDTLKADFDILLDLICLEGRNVTGTIANLKDFGEVTAPNVMVCIAADPATVDLDTSYQGTAAMGSLLGALAVRNVGENVGSVNVINKPDAFKADPNYTLTSTSVPNRWLNAELSSGVEFSTLTKTEQTTLASKGYVYVGSFHGYPGFYFNNDRTCVTPSDDYSNARNNRVWNKAVREIVPVLIPKVRGSFPLDDAGDIKSSFRTAWEEEVNKVLDAMVNNGEMSSFNFYIVTRAEAEADAEIGAYNIQNGDNIPFKLSLVTTGSPNGFTGTIGLTTATV